MGGKKVGGHKGGGKQGSGGRQAGTTTDCGGGRRRGADRSTSSSAHYSKSLVGFGGTLRALGLQLKKVARDGNCFFRALADQCDEDEGALPNHPQNIPNVQEEKLRLLLACSTIRSSSGAPASPASPSSQTSRFS